MKRNRINFCTTAARSPFDRQNYTGVQLLFFILLSIGFSCTTERTADGADNGEEIEIPFDKNKWRTKKGSDYPYRDQMLNDILYTDMVRALGKDEIVSLLGKPDRINEGHLYYMIVEKRMGFWTLHTKVLVIKLIDDNTVEWIKLHE